MALTALEIKDKRFYVKFRGYDAKEVEEFQDMVYRDYEKLVRENHELETKISALEERLNYFDEMKDSLSQSVLIAQDTAERVKHAANERSETIVRQAEQDAHHLVEEAKAKANEILRHATDNAKKVAVETEELKNKTRVFHQRLKSTIESQLAIVDSSEWEEILRPTATYLQTSDEAFKEVVEEVLGEATSSFHEEDPIDMTRQFSPEEVAEFQARIEAANKELLEAQQATANQDVEETTEPEVEVQPVVETPVESANDEEPQDDANTQQESVLIL